MNGTARTLDRGQLITPGVFHMGMIKGNKISYDFCHGRVMFGGSLENIPKTVKKFVHLHFRNYVEADHRHGVAQNER